MLGRTFPGEEAKSRLGHNIIISDIDPNNLPSVSTYAPELPPCPQPFIAPPEFRTREPILFTIGARTARPDFHISWSNFFGEYKFDPEEPFYLENNTIVRVKEETPEPTLLRRSNRRRHFPKCMVKDFLPSRHFQPY